MSAGGPGSRSNTIIVGRLTSSAAPARCAARCRRGSPARPSVGRSLTRQKSMLRLLCRLQTAAVWTQSGPVATGTASRRSAGRRRSGSASASAAGRAGAAARGRDPHVVVDQLALGEAGLRIHDLVEVGQRRRLPISTSRRLGGAPRRGSRAAVYAVAGSYRVCAGRGEVRSKRWLPNPKSTRTTRPARGRAPLLLQHLEEAHG